jgi:hypothetical protein
MITNNKNYFDELLKVAGLGEKNVIKLYEKYGLNAKFVEKKYKKN